MTHLSITIPSYNRVAELEVTLSALLPLVGDPDIEVVVMDNCSDTVLSEAMNVRFEKKCGRIRFVRHVCNLGLVGNLLRCFEVASGDWVWLLGDDDPPLPDSVDRILDAIAAAEASDVLLKFNSSNGGEVSALECLSSLECLASRCTDMRFYSNLLFISSGVFRKEPMLNRLNIGLHWAYSFAPQIAMLIDAMASGSSIRLFPHYIVTHGKQRREGLWNSVRQMSGLPALCDLEKGQRFAVDALPWLARGYLGKLWWRGMVGRFLTDTTRSPEFWLSFYLRYGGVIRGWRGLVMVQFAEFLFVLSKIRLLRKFVATVKKPISTIENLDRS